MRKRTAIITLLLCGCLLAGGCSSKTTEAGNSSTKNRELSGTEEGMQSADADGQFETTETEGLGADADSELLSDGNKDPIVRKVTITATGDCTFASTQTHGYAGSLHEYYDNYGEEYFFRGVRDVFEEDDFTLINLECVLTTSEERVEKTWNLKGKPEYVGIMTSSSVEACSLGNNHTQDYGPSSLTDTQNALDGADIKYGYNEHTAIYTTDQDVVVGIVSANLLYQTEEYENYIKNGIASLRDQGADLVIACCHWGIEREYYPMDYQITTAHKIIDWGADLVIGNHPHVLQGVEYYNGKIICYSLGNFCFGGNSNPADKDTMMYQQTFTFVDGDIQEELDARIIPCTLSSVSGYNDYQPTIVSGDKKAQIISNLNDYSAPYSDISFDPEGILHYGEETVSNKTD